MDLRAIVETEGLPDERELNEILRRRGSLIGSGESVLLEFKEGFENETRSWIELLKDLVAFSNTKGGLVVLGVSDAGDLVGLDRSLASDLDPAKIANKLARYAPNSRIEPTYVEWTYFNKLYGALRIPPGRHLVVFDKPGNYQASDGRQRNGFQEGVVYVRGVGMCAPARQLDIDRLVRASVEREMSLRLARIEMVASLPSSADLMARNPASPESAYVLQSKETGTPVQIVSDAPPGDAVLLAEVLDASAPFSSLESEIKQQVRFWRAHPEHRAAASTLHDWYLRDDDAEFDGDMAEFCFLSAVKNHAFPLIWASRLGTDRLRDLLDREREQSWYPLNAIVPYIIATFFWDERDKLLHPWKPKLRGNGSSVASKVLKMEREEFLVSGRYAVKAAPDPRDPKSRILLSDLANSRASTIDVFATIVRLVRDDLAPSPVKQLGFQCDILLAAPDGAIESRGVV